MLIKGESKMIKVTDIENWNALYDDNTIIVEIKACISFEEGEHENRGYVCISAYDNNENISIRLFRPFNPPLLYNQEYKGEFIKKRYEHFKKYIYDHIPSETTKEWFYEHGFTYY